MLLYTVVLLTFWCICFGILVSCTVDVIHAVCGNIWNFLFSHVEFYFCWFDTDHFLYKPLELLYSFIEFYFGD